MRKIFLTGLCGLLFAGCAPQKIDPNAIGPYTVTTDTAFYRYGPAQTNGADFMLLKDARVTVLSRRWGYSQITMADGQTGYVATEDLNPAGPADLEGANPHETFNLDGSTNPMGAAAGEEEVWLPSDVPADATQPAPATGDAMIAPVPVQEPGGLPEFPSPQTPTFRY